MERTHRPMTGLPLVTNHQPALLMMMLDHGQTGHLRRRKLSPSLSSLTVIVILIFVRYCVHVALLFRGRVLLLRYRIAGSSSSSQPLLCNIIDGH